MRSGLSKFGTLAGFLLLSVAAAAHHSISVEFDTAQRLIFEGVVTKVEWTNPHIYFYADIKEKDGKSIGWAFEAAGPNQLLRSGWSRDSLKRGDHVTIVGFPARGGARVASARSVVVAGHKMSAGSAFDGVPEP
jgi:hypothetical protein